MMQRPVDRQFYSLDTSGIKASHFQTSSTQEKEALVTYVAENVIGNNKTFSTPFGLRKGK